LHSIQADGSPLSDARASADHSPRWLIALAVLLALAAGAVSALFGGVQAIIFFAVLAFMVFAVSDYRAGILIAMVLLPLSASRLVPREIFGITGLNPLNATLAMASFSILFMWLFQRHRMAVPRSPTPFAVYIGAIALAALYGSTQVGLIPPFFRALDVINFDSSAGYLRDVFMKPMLILVTAFLLAVLVRNARHPQRVLLPFFMASLILPLYVIGYLAASGVSLGMLASAESRAVLSVSGMHANELGLLFNMALALALFTMLGSRGLARWALAVTAGVLAVSVLLTFSRGAFVGLMVLAAYFLFTERRFKVLLLGLLLLPGALMLLPQAVVERATTGMQTRNVEAISAGRVDNIWRPLAPEILKSPVVGHGLGSMLWAEPVRNGSVLKVGHPHNAYLALLLDLGILGAVLVVWFFWHMRGLFLKLRRQESDPLWQSFFRGGTACILLLLVQGVTDDRFTPTFAQTYLWLAYGFAIGLAARQAGPTAHAVPEQRP
jgi:O-antigen ligase